MTVAEFAKKQGVSKSSIYNKLNTVYKDCVVVKNGIRYIETDKIKATKSTVRQTPVVEQTAIQLDNNDDKQQETVEEDKVIAEKEVDKRQTAEEDKKIRALEEEVERLRKELDDERKASKDKETRILDMTEKVIKLTENAQIAKNIFDKYDKSNSRR